ncbi:hypothetical protein PSENEW3n2_00000720 [Picochlorum sp. SENEW3]|nr:hypothetical protein PSENEW3n2_00000720 [Picochlorum sp. SENEW3]WPT15641.1 hypothetical protein PSENEW3_00000720 [Picochlorum sp. SENEW3]
MEVSETVESNWGRANGSQNGLTVAVQNRHASQIARVNYRQDMTSNRDANMQFSIHMTLANQGATSAVDVRVRRDLGSPTEPLNSRIGHAENSRIVDVKEEPVSDDEVNYMGAGEGPTERDFHHAGRRGNVHQTPQEAPPQRGVIDSNSTNHPIPPVVANRREENPEPREEDIPLADIQRAILHIISGNIYDGVYVSNTMIFRMMQSACPHISPQHVELQDSLSERIQYLVREKVRRGLSREFTKAFLNVYQYEYGEQNVHLDGRKKVYISQALRERLIEGENQGRPSYRYWGGDPYGNPIFRRLLFALQDAHLQVFGFNRQDFPNLRYTQDINEGIRTIPPAILAFYVCKVRGCKTLLDPPASTEV